MVDRRLIPDHYSSTTSLRHSIRRARTNDALAGTFGNQYTNEIRLNLDSNLRINCYGHIGDGNIHVNIFPPDTVTKQAYLEGNINIKGQFHTIINEVTLQCHGAISAEHGIGRLKTKDMQEYLCYRTAVLVEQLYILPNPLQPISVLSLPLLKY